jgi:hypothetical protein
MSEYDKWLDQPGYGARFVATVLNLRDEDGALDLDRAYYLLQNGQADASKVGRIWTSTPRRLLSQHLSKSETA